LEKVSVSRGPLDLVTVTLPYPAATNYL
jgi:hypothetical protein